ncbi:MAG: energy transducer TonB [Polaromonas sp.]|nr:energy transducer TonB [Polaromonas sp.]
MNAPAIPGSNAPALPLAPVRLPISRNIVIAASVVIFHVAVLWAMQNGLLRRAAEVVMPAEILNRIIEIEPPKVAPPPPPPPPKPAPKVPRPPPMPVAIREPVPTPAPNAPVGVVEPQPPAPPIPAPPVPAPPAPPAPARMIEVTEGETRYVKAPEPVWPRASQRSGESGKVVIAVYYNAAGRAVRASVFQSSGFERLDRAAYEAVMASQVTPFRRAGTDANTEYLLKAPINFQFRE